jgi:hypothetical protein
MGFRIAVLTSGDASNATNGSSTDATQLTTNSSCSIALIADGIVGNAVIGASEHGSSWYTGVDDIYGNYIQPAGNDAFLRWAGPIGTSDFTSRMFLLITHLGALAIVLEFNENSHFGFGGTCGCVFVNVRSMPELAHQTWIET